MREPLAFEVRAALRARIQALGKAAARAAVDGDARDVQVVGVHVVIVAGVGDGAAHEFLDRLGGKDVGELQQHERFAHALAANRVGDAAQLARPGAHEAQVRDGSAGGVCSVTPSPSPYRRRARGSGASVRTRRACARPCFR